jgi:hypothetical protein
MRVLSFLAVVLFSCSLAQSFSGTFRLPTENGGITLVLNQDDVGNVTGTLAGNGTTFTLTGELGDREVGVAYGIVETPSGRLLFEAYLEEPELTLYILGVDESGQADYDTAEELSFTRQGNNPLAMPLAQNANSSPILAQGQYASLSQDNALAFIEALEFSLNQVGYSHRFTETDYEQLLQALTQSFPGADQQDQAVLSQARDIWTRVSANWSTASDDDKKEFILGVFILAFGEETVQQWVTQNNPQNSSSQELGSGGSCSGYDECASRYLDGETWTDSYNAQGCWAAAGCSSYDSSSNTFTYED